MRADLTAPAASARLSRHDAQAHGEAVAKRHAQGLRTARENVADSVRPRFSFQ